MLRVIMQRRRPAPRIDDQRLNSRRNQDLWDYFKTNKMAATKRRYFLSMLRSALLWKFPRNLGFPTKTEPKLREFQSQAIKAASNQALGSFHFRPAHCPRHPLVCLFGSICSFASTTWFSTLILLPCKVLSQ